MASVSHDYSFEVIWRNLFRDLLRIAPSDVVDMVARYHINHPGQYPDHPSYYINHVPTSSLSQPNMFDHAARYSYPGDHSVVDPNRWQVEGTYKDLKTRRSREEDQIQGNICVVCLDDLYENENDDETIATLHCGHEYHMHCIKRWLRQKNVCPLCNAAAVLPQH